MTPERLAEIRDDFARREAKGGQHGCDGCGCSCCRAVGELLALLSEQREAHE